MRTIAIVLLSSLGLVGCDERSADEAKPAPARAAPAGDSFCKEHGVAEAVCTKCNPKLIPIFRAKGDWCAEHGFPESFCPTCHPERGGRPAAEIAADAAPAEGTRVSFKTHETARLAGIETVEAIEEALEEEITATARLAYDARRRAVVNARVPGVVEELLADVGERVEAGAPLARLRSSEIGAEQARAKAAAARIESARATLERERAMLAKGLSTQKNLLAAELALKEAESELASAQVVLGMVALDPADPSRYAVLAPIAGTVIERSATLGAMVRSEETLFELVDLSSMWAEIEVPESELGQIAIGQRAKLAVDALGAREFEGRVEFIAPSVDAATRTVRVRVRLDNPDGVLRANMFARARIVIAEAQPFVLVPRVALQEVAGSTLAFVQLAEDSFEVRRVEVGPGHGDFVALLRGVRAGERVATSGSFLLKTETLKGSIGAGCCDVD